MSHQVKWVKRPTLRPDDSGAAATLSRSAVSWAAASRIVARRDESTRELPTVDASADGTGEIDLDDVLAIELLPGRGPKVSVSATCELQAEDVLDVLALPEPFPIEVELEPAPASVAPPPWVTDAFEPDFSAAPQGSRRQLGVWVAAAAAAACFGMILAAAAVKAESSTALVLPRVAHRAAARAHVAERVHAHGSRIPVVSLASLGR